MCGGVAESTAELEEGICSHVADAVACIGNEVPIHMSEVTLDDKETNVPLILSSQKEWAIIGNREGLCTINSV